MQKVVYRMSEAGYCAKRLSAVRNGLEAEPAPAWLEQAAEEGVWHELRIKDILKSQNLHVYDEQRELTLDYPSFVLIGHIDGVVEDGNDPNENTKLLEIKSMSQFEFDRWMKDRFEAFPHYADQLACYLEATGLDSCLYIVKNRSSGYIDRQALANTAYFKARFAKVAQKLEMVEEYALRSELVPAEFDVQSIECRRCSYKHLCVPEPKELTPVEEASLETATEEWRKGKQLVQVGQQLVDRARETFETHSKATGIPRWQYSGLALNLIHYKESKTYPKVELLKIFTEEQLEPASKRKEAYDQLRIEDLRAEEVSND